MKPHLRCILHIPRRPIHRTQWHRIASRYYSADAAEPKWFVTMREKMLKRHLPEMNAALDRGLERELEEALSSVIPLHKTAPPDSNVLPVGHHHVYFKRTVPKQNQFPDGTDRYHAPNRQYTRRLWGGGSLEVYRGAYYDQIVSRWAYNRGVVCLERITNVQRGGADGEKIVVGLKRTFRSIGEGRYRRGSPKKGQTSLTEKINLVFMKPLESPDVADNPQTPKYLPSALMREPEFSYSLTPTAELIATYSRLSGNPHLIHLDLEHTRNVEGHRNLLVHGPLILTLLLRFITHQEQARTGRTPRITSVEYKNLAPLYCGEEMQLHGRETSASGASKTYAVWIEVPGHGVAVKGTISVTEAPEPPAWFGRPESRLAYELRRQIRSKPIEKFESPSLRTTEISTHNPSEKVEHSSPPTSEVDTSEAPSSPISQVDTSAPPSPPISETATTSPPDSAPTSAQTTPVPQTHRPRNRSEKRRLRAQALGLPIIRRLPYRLDATDLSSSSSDPQTPQNTPDPQIPLHGNQAYSGLAIRFINTVRVKTTQHKRLKPKDPHAPLDSAEYVLQRTRPKNLKYLSPVRYYKAGSWEAEEQTPFKKQGVKKIENLRVRKVQVSDGEAVYKKGKGWVKVREGGRKWGVA
ncbi:hypothetical protein M011DRAFT_417659, partial [Sporormia fimetaria CBS 119925]